MSTDSRKLQSAPYSRITPMALLFALGLVPDLSSFIPLPGLDQAGLQDQAVISDCTLFPPGKLIPAINGHHKNREGCSSPHPGEAPTHCLSWVSSTSNSIVTPRETAPSTPRLLRIPHWMLCFSKRALSSFQKSQSSGMLAQKSGWQFTL